MTSPVRLVLLILLAPLLAYARDHYCEPLYPRKDTARLLVRLVEEGSTKLRGDDRFLAHGKSLTSPDGTELYVNNAIPDFVRRPAHEGGGHLCHYDFSSLHYFLHSVVVASDEDTAERVRNNETHLLHRLSFMCPQKSSCCGLFCCPRSTRTVQEAFLNVSLVRDDSDFRQLEPETTVTHDGREYALNNDARKHSCVYHLDSHDLLRKEARMESDQIEYIYFSCPPRAECCQLECRETREARHAQPRVSLSVKENSEKINFHRFATLLFIGVGAAIVALSVGLFTICKVHHKKITKRSESIRKLRERMSRDTMSTPLPSPNV